jgi:hypothetical protein
MSTALVRKRPPSRVGLFLRRIDRSFVYVLEIGIAVFVLFNELALLVSFLDKPFLGNWLLLCLWAFSPALPVPIHPLPASVFWGMFLMLLMLVILPGVAVYLVRDGIFSMLAWSRDPNGQALKQMQRERVHLAYLRVKALEENEQNYYLKYGTFPPSSSAYSPTISKYAGPWSFYYVTLSNYLRLPPPAPKQRRRETSSMVDMTSTLEEAQKPIASFPAHVQVAYALFVFGGVRFLLRGAKTVEVAVKSFRVRELLAYLALPAREKGRIRDDIVNAIHEDHALRDDDDPDGNALKKARDAFAYDVKALGKLLQQACREADLLYIDPVESDRGAGAFHRLADAYVVEDVTRLTRLEEQLTTMKKTSVTPLALEAFRADYTEVLELYEDGLLGRELRQRAAPWYKPYYTHYQEIYQQVLQGLAEYELGLGCEQQGEERKASLRQAASLYEQCAFLTAPSGAELEQGSYAPLSEHALRQCLRAYGLLGDLSSAHQVYHQYLKTLKRKFRSWHPDPQTVQIFQEVTRSSEEI